MHEYFTLPLMAFGHHMQDNLSELDEKKLSLNLSLSLTYQLMSIVFGVIALVVLLFRADPNNGRVLPKPYIRGNAILVLASKMSLNACDTPYLSSLYSEICFKCLVFKTAGHDHCPVLDICIRENHYYSNFLMKSINYQNYRYLVIFQYNSMWFLTLALINIWKEQKQISLECSNFILRVAELHFMGLLRMFDTLEITIFLLSVLILELLVVINFQSLYHHLYCIGREITNAELSNPWLYTRSRMDTLFKI